jgi:hypothetical protein
MLYIRGRCLKAFIIFNVEEAEWQDPVPETVDTEGKANTVTEKCTVPKSMEINKA